MGKTLGCLNASPNLCSPSSQQNWPEMWLRELAGDRTSLPPSARPEAPTDGLLRSRVRTGQSGEGDPPSAAALLCR